LGPLVRAYFDQVGWNSVPANPEASHISYVVQVAHKGDKPESVNGALWRELFSVFADEGVVLISVALDAQKQLFRALGFERLAIGEVAIWGSSEPFEAYVLDLRAIGLEPWIEAIMAGRRPPRALSPEELERAVQAALVHWHDDAWLADSDLAHSTSVARMAPDHIGAEAAHVAVGRALERTRASAVPEQALAYRALESAYLSRTSSHERAAEELAVSRTTFYRLIRRGIHGLAQALQRT